MNTRIASNTIIIRARSVLAGLELDRSSGFLASMKVAFTVSLALSLGLILLELMGLSPVAALRDAGSSDKLESGLISNIRIVLMICAGLIALAGAFRHDHVALGVMGAFCCLFALDDGLLIHERFGQWEIIAYGFYAGMMLFIFYLYLNTKAVLPMALLVCLAAFGASVVLDLFWSSVTGSLPILQDQSWLMTQLGYIFEDVPKFTGIVLLFSFALGEYGYDDR